jgi:hypothetical protein
MPAKKKKAKKKKAAGEEEKKDEDEAPKPMYEIPEYLDPAKYTPICTVKFQLISPSWTHFNFEWQTMISTRLFRLEEQIRKRHGNSIGDVSMCINCFDPELVEKDPSKTLRDCGIASACDVNICYDFVPKSTPVLTTPFNYRTQPNERIDAL